MRRYLATVAACCCLSWTVAAEGRKSRPVRPGRLLVLSATSGADIAIDRQHVATVPHEEPFLLTPGDHYVKVSLRGYTAYEDEIHLRAGRETVIEADLIAHSGILMVETAGITAEVVIDGTPLGPTPFDGEVTIGERLIEVRAPGHVTWRTKVTVKGGQLYPANVELRPVGEPIPDAQGEEGGGGSWFATGGPWYDNPWVWVGAGAAALTLTAVGIGVAAGGEPEPPKPNARVTVLEGGGYQ